MLQHLLALARRMIWPGWLLQHAQESKCGLNLVMELDQFFLELFALLNLTQGAARVFEIFSKHLQLIVGTHVIFSVLPQSVALLMRV